MKILTKKFGDKRAVDSANIVVDKPTMIGIIGSSGAGKSTLLHAMAGRVKDNPKLQLYGNRYMNGVPVAGDSMLPAAFIEQEVNFFPHMTVRETLQFRVELKLGSKLSKHARDDMVQDLMDMVDNTMITIMMTHMAQDLMMVVIIVMIIMINKEIIIKMLEDTIGG